MATINIDNYVDLKAPDYYTAIIEGSNNVLWVVFNVNLDYSSSNTYTMTTHSAFAVPITSAFKEACITSFKDADGSRNQSWYKNTTTYPYIFNPVLASNDYKFQLYLTDNSTSILNAGVSISSVPTDSISYCAFLVAFKFNNDIYLFGGGGITNNYIQYPNSEPAKIASLTNKGIAGRPFLSGHITLGLFNSYQTTLARTSITKYLQGATLLDPNNPYSGGDSNTDPGDGSFDYTGDEIGIPDLPTVSVTDSGFVSLFAPSSAQLQSLAAFMWSDAFSLDSFKKLFNNPMDCILGLSIIPVNVPTSGTKEITVGNIVSTVSCNAVSTQFISVDCGTLTISPTRFTGGYLDYSPYTKAYIYLPFIGIQQLNIDDIMNSTLHVVYHVDLLTGGLVCYVQATNRTTGGVSQPDAVLYTYAGSCAESVPLSSSDFSSTYGSLLTMGVAAGGLIATAATGGTAAPVAAKATTLAGAAVSATTGSKPSVQHSGQMGGVAGMMNIKYPFMIFDCPHTAIPVKQYEYTGFPSNKIVKFSSLSGYATIQAVNLSVAHATDQECDEIKRILQEGVIF